MLRPPSPLGSVLYSSLPRAPVGCAADGPPATLQPLPRQPRPSPRPLIGDSPAMERLRQLIRRFAPTELPVVIHGESGTGKELVAQALHEASGRRGDLIAVNCGALPRELIESELFGHERGAFTGAQQRRLGCFGEANGGTLFLDEIGELPLELQPRLLRALESRHIRPIGAGRELFVDVRIIAATHRDLEQAVAQGLFRADLYYRLCALELDIPPLRQRVQDIPLLVRHFLDELGQHRPRPFLPEEELKRLLVYPWPGNVRQLRHAILRAVHLGGTQLQAADILGSLRPGQPVRAAPGRSLADGDEKLGGRSFAEIERQVFVQALAQSNGSCRAAAELLKVPKSTLHDKLRRLGITPKPRPEAPPPAD